MRCRLALAGCLGVLLVSCADDPGAPKAPLPSSSFAISDGAHGGNPHFFFLNPMVPAPKQPEGVFDGGQQPLVEICVWNGSACRVPIALFTTLTGPGSETIRVSTTDQHYVVNWHAKDIIGRFPLGTEEEYRIRVLVGNKVLGYADVKVVNSGKELKNVQTDQYVPLLNGRTLPIKFRIEHGALDQKGGGDVNAGGHHGCAVDNVGSAYCWGGNWSGELGDGTTEHRLTPVPVAGGHVFKSVSAGVYHTCGVTTAGAAYCWGSNAFGQLGDGNSGWDYWRTTPVAVARVPMFESVEAGEFHTCGMTPGGEAYCWGYNAYGQLGTGFIDYVHALPHPVMGEHTFQSISPGFGFTCGLTTSGSALCWGSNEYGQLGRGTHTFIELTPVAVSGTFQSLGVGVYHTCGVHTDGAAYCWGYNEFGQLGEGSFSTEWPQFKSSPVPVADDHVFSAITAGAYHNCGLRPDATALCWGHNYYGQLGDGTFTREEPRGNARPQIVHGHEFARVSAGYVHTCGATTTGEALCWGSNSNGELGDGTYVWRSEPVFTLNLRAP